MAQDLVYKPNPYAKTVCKIDSDSITVAKPE